MTLSCRTARRGLLVLPLLVLLALLGLAPAAVAAPPGPTLTLDELTTKLASGPMTGYMKTAMHDTTVENISLRVVGLVKYSYGTLILFDSSASEITNIGGIAAGMSGSPVYVNDGGIDKLVGAVSYGDWFTLHGMGMATPIEYMAAVESTFLPTSITSVGGPSAGTYKLAEPARTSEGVVRSVIVARNAKQGAAVRATEGQSVMVPLGLMEIGGLRPQSKAFKKLAAKFEKTGLTVKAASGDGTWAGAATPALEAGSPCAAVFSRGAVWWGAAGTVTYVNNGVAMLFGHPLWWVGSTNAVLTGGYVEGVWASSIEPYKLITPADTKGTVVQDRWWGVAGKIGQEPDMYPVTTHATFPAEGIVASDSSSVSQWMATQRTYADAPAYIVEEAILDASDQEMYSGSAETTTTIVVSDNTGHTYTIKRTNLWDSPYVNWRAASDVADAMWSIASDPDGILHARVVSVNVDARLSHTRRSARVVNVELPRGLRNGANPVTISYYRHGSSDLQTVQTTLTIPAGTSVNGRLSVTPGSWGDYGFCCCCCGSPGSTSGSAPQTLAELVDEINGQAANSDVILSFQPYSDGESDEEPAEISVTVPVGYVISNSFSQATARVEVVARPSQVPYSGAALLSGYVRVSDDIAVSIYRRDAGSTREVLVKKLTAKADGGMAAFRWPVTGLKHNSTLIARTAATASQLPGSASDKVKVHARVKLSGGANGVLRISVLPGDARGKVRIQRKLGNGWATLGTATVKKGQGKYRLPHGSYVLRACFLGCTGCAPGTSPSVTTVVR